MLLEFFRVFFFLLIQEILPIPNEFWLIWEFLTVFPTIFSGFLIHLVVHWFALLAVVGVYFKLIVWIRKKEFQTFVFEKEDFGFLSIFHKIHSNSFNSVTDYLFYS